MGVRRSAGCDALGGVRLTIEIERSFASKRSSSDGGPSTVKWLTRPSTAGAKCERLSRSTSSSLIRSPFFEVSGKPSAGLHASVESVLTLHGVTLKPAGGDIRSPRSWIERRAFLTAANALGSYLLIRRSDFETRWRSWSVWMTNLECTLLSKNCCGLKRLSSSSKLAEPSPAEEPGSCVGKPSGYLAWICSTFRRSPAPFGNHGRIRLPPSAEQRACQTSYQPLSHRTHLVLSGKA